MAEHLFQPAAAAAVILALAMLGVTRLASSLRLYGLQTLMLGALAIRAGALHREISLIVVGCAVVAVKAVGIPIYLAHTARRIGCRRDSDTIIAPPLQLFMAIGGLALLILDNPFGDDVPPGALLAIAMLALGMLLMLTRRLAISQILGFLVLENGIFLYTIAQRYEMPLIVEMGVLMDVLAGTMLAGLLTFRISRTFEHIDVARLRELRG